MKTFKLASLLLLIAFSAGCTRPKGGICGRCPVWFLDPICLTGGDAPEPLPGRAPKSPPPKETDLVPGQDSKTYKAN